MAAKKFNLVVTGANYLQHIDFAEDKDVLVNAAKTNDFEMICEVLNKHTTEPWAVGGLNYSLKNAEVLYCGENSADYFTLPKYKTVIIIKTDPKFNKIEGDLHICMTE